MIYLFWVAVLGAIALGLAMGFGRRIEETFAPAVFLAVLVLYLLGLAGPLKAGLWLVAGLGALGAGYAVLCMVRKKSALLQYWLTPGLVALAVLALYIGWMQAGRMCIENDEFSHWAWCVKVMSRYDQLGIWHAGELGFAEYPPALALFEYLFIRLTPAFTESYLYRALAVFLAALLLPVLARFSWKRLGGAAVSLAGLCLLPLAFFPQFYSDLKVDGALGLLLAYLLYAWFSERKLDGFMLLRLSLGIAVLVLTKESGVVLALAALAAIGWDALALAKKAPGGIKAALPRLAAPAAALVLAKGSWSAVVALQGLRAGGSGNLLGRLASLLRPWPEARSLTLAGFLRHLLLPGETQGAVSPPLLFWLVLALAALVLAARLAPQLAAGLRRAAAVLGWGFAAYCLGLLYLYFFQFSEYEATHSASLERYLGSWLLAAVLFAASLLLTARTAEKEKTGACRCAPALVLAAALLALPGTTAELNRLVSPASGAAAEQAYRSAYFTPATFPFAWNEGDAVYFVAEDTAVYEPICANYSFYPQNIGCSLGYNFNTSDPDYALWSSEVSAEEWAAALAKEYTYVYLFQISDTFAAKYASLFADPGDITGRCLYRVEKAGGRVSLARAWPEKAG